MANDLYTLFKDYNKANIIDWSKDIYYYFFRPKYFFNKIHSKSYVDILPQYIFYTIIYVSSFLLLDSKNTTNELIILFLKTSIAYLFPIIIAIASSYIVTQKNNTKRILNFFITTFLITNTLGNYVFSLFLYYEHYLLLLIFSILCSIVTFYRFFLFSYFTLNKWSHIIKSLFINYLFINLFILFLLSYSFDSYHNEPIPTEIEDPIYLEYGETFSNIKEPSKIPMQLLFSYYGNIKGSSFVTMDIIDDSIATGGDLNNKLYKKSIKENITYLKTQLPKFRYSRNKYIFTVWLDYFEEIDSIINYAPESIDEVKKLPNVKYIRAYFDDSTGFVSQFIYPIDWSNLFSSQYILKEYHNNIIANHNLASKPILYANYTIFGLAGLSHSIYFDYFIADRKRIYKDKFEPLDSEKY